MATAPLVVRDGVIVARGSYPSVRANYPDELVEDLRGGILVPGFVDTLDRRALGG